MHNIQRWRFGPFEADAAERRLLRDGQVVPLTQKSFALLGCLLSRPGRLFTKAELFDTVWAGTVVTDAALSRVIRELRIALGDDANAPRYIATAHRLGFRFVALVSLDRQDAESGQPPASAQPRMLVGRDPELAILDAALANARVGKRQVVFVTGEAGIGKSALVETFIERHAGRSDLSAAQGRCVEQYGTGEAYLPILEALESLARQLGADVVRNVLARYAPAWLAQLPWLAHDADPKGAQALAQRALADTTAQRMLREIAQALEVLAADRPIVLWLEDLHWSDPSSLAVVSFLAGRRDPARLLLIGSFRPAEVRVGDSPLHRLALQLTQRGQASELELDLWDLPAVVDYLKARFGGATGMAVDDLGAFVHRRTDGHALFTVAIVDDLVRRRSLTMVDSAWALAGSVAELGGGLPDDLRQLVLDQIERLPENDRRLIEAAAVAGTDFSAAALAAALQADTAETEDRCARLAQQGRFLRTRAVAAAAWPDGTASAGFGFVHALYWQGTYEQVPQTRRADWHRRIGLRQEQAYGTQCALIATELAMRFEAARDVERSLRYLQLAGSGALSRCAYPEAIELLRHALMLVPELPADQQARSELDLALPLGAALMASQGYASDDVEATYQRALALCDAGASPGQFERVLRGLWNVAFLRADLNRARQMAGRLLAQAEATNNTRLAADAHTKLGQTCIHLGDLAAARDHLEKAFVLSTDTDDVTLLRDAPRVAIYLSWALWYTGFPAQALHQADEASRLAGLAASPHSTAFALGYGAQLNYWCGDVAQEIALARQLSSLSTEYGITYWRLLADFSLARASGRGGDRPRDTNRMRRAMHAMRSAGGLVGIPYMLCVVAEAELASGRLDAAREALAESSSLVSSNGNALYAAESLRLQGEVALADSSDPQRLELAEQHFISALTLASGQGARSLELRAATSLARLWAGGGQVARAIELLAPAFASFNEGLETVDLVRAKLLLDELAGRRGAQQPA